MIWLAYAPSIALLVGAVLSLFSFYSYWITPFLVIMLVLHAGTTTVMLIRGARE